MPEGDVVLRTARRLHAALAGQVLSVADLRWPSLATADLTGREVREVVSAGKHLLIRIKPLVVPSPTSVTDQRLPGRPAGQPSDPLSGLTLHTHLRMEGSWHVHRTGERWRSPRPEHAVRAVLANATWTAIGHRLGMMDLVATDRESELVGHLGPDILAPDWDDVTAAGVVAQIEAQPDRAIGEALLDQRLLAGIGTFFMAESCFLRGVNPWTPVRDERDVRALVDLAHRLMTANAERAVQVTTGDARRGQEQWVHARSGRPCRRCRTTIRVAQLGTPPNDRVAFWCPRCQPGDVPTDTGGRQSPLGANRRSGPPRSPNTYRRR